MSFVFMMYWSCDSKLKLRAKLTFGSSPPDYNTQVTSVVLEHAECDKW